MVGLSGTSLTGRVRTTILALDVMVACLASIFFLDLKLVQFAVAERDSVTAVAMRLIPDLGSPEALMNLVLPLAAVTFLRSEGIAANRTLLLFGTVSTSHLIADLFKFLFGRCRPDLFFANGLYGFDFFKWDYAFHSFPSAHAAIATGLAAALSYVYPARKLTIMTGGFALAVFPVATGVHFLSDAVFGFSIGVLSAAAFKAAMGWFGLPITDATTESSGVES